MIRVDKLRGRMAEKGFTGQDMARSLNIAAKTFYDKMKKGAFGSDEIERMVEILDIEKPWEFFFVKE